MSGKKVLFLAGELSGDSYAGLVIEELLRRRSDWQIYAMGGKYSYRAGARIIADPTGISVVGVFEVLKHIKEFSHIYRTVKEFILESRPDAIVFVDYPGFNLRIARDLRDELKGTKFIYYISPQLWAWHKERIKFMRMMDRIFVIFPFEVDFYKQYDIDVEFVGHPLAEVLDRLNNEDDFYPQKTGKNHISLLPGSRRQEIDYNLFVMLACAKKMKQDFSFSLHMAETIPNYVYENWIKRFDVEVELLERKRHPYGFRKADILWVCSGTATVESMYYVKPMIVTYKVHPITYFLLRPFVKINYISMVNILADKRIVPELLQWNYNVLSLYEHTKKIVEDESVREQMIAELKSLKEKVFIGGASRRVADGIIDICERR